MRIAGWGHAAFAAVMIALGIQGLVTGELTALWQPIPKGVPAHQALAYLCALVSLATGFGLLWKRTAASAARLLLGYFLVWALLFRLPPVFHAPAAILPYYGCAEMAVMVAGAWVLYAWFSTSWERLLLGFATGDRGVRIARVLYGLCMIPFGLAHFIYIQHIAELVPGWVPAHVAVGYVTGSFFLAAGAGILLGIFPRLAAALSALQIGLFTLLVWVPIVTGGPKDPYDWIEFVTSVALTAGGWVVADSYRDVPWLALRRLRT
jgi:uncharacterized membrane protein